MPERQKLFQGAMPHRLAAIDIGTNSMRLVVAEALRDASYRILDEEREPTRLGRSLQATGQLDPEAIEQSLSALRRFKQIAEGFNVDELRAIATCAVREATNGGDFCRRAQEDIGLEIEVISAEKEADLAFYSVRRNFDLQGKTMVMADIGGGSTEIVLASGPLVEAIFPTDLGAVRLSEMFGGQATLGDDYEHLLAYIDRRLRKKTKKLKLQPHVLIGSGGTFTNVASMMMAAKNQSNLPMRGYQVSWAELRHLLDRLRKMSPKARRNVPGLNADRADIIVAGLAIIDRLLHRFDLNSMLIHNGGVRDGLILSMIDQAHGARRPTTPVDRQQAVERFAAACGSDVEHGRHVARLAGQIFQQLAAPLGLRAEDQPLLEAAARLQDVGYLINYERHHKHSYHLILNSRMDGFQPHELELIANVARYHRGAEPKKKHANYSQLAPEDRQRVKQMAAILRLAGGLDRSHSQQVESVSVEPGADAVTLCVHAQEYPDVDVWGARRRADMFEKVFDAVLSIEWDSAGEPVAASGSNGASPVSGRRRATRRVPETPPADS